MKGHLWTVVLVAVGVLGIAGSCTEPVEGERIAYRTVQQSEDTLQLPVLASKGAGSLERLTSLERAQFNSDWAYIRKIVKPNTAVRLNFADPRQFRYVMSRLKIAGKSRASSPFLFESLETIRAQHRAMMLAPGEVTAVVSADSTPVSPERDSEIINYEIINEDESPISRASTMHYMHSTTIYSPETGEATAASTAANGSNYVYLDCAVRDEDGRALSPFTFTEEFDDGRSIHSQAEADLSLARMPQYYAESFKYEQVEADGSDGQTTYYYTTFGLQEVEPPDLDVMEVRAPKDIKYNDGIVTICLNRTWTQDCDYDLTGTPQAVKVPLDGSIQIASDHVFDDRVLARWKQVLQDNCSDPDNLDDICYGEYGHVKVLLPDVGGGCDLQDGGRQANMLAFWDSVTLNVDKNILDWDLTGEGSASFGDRCRLVNQSVGLTMRIRLPVSNPDGSGYADVWVTLSTEVEEIDKEYQFAPIEMVNSCLAEGTKVEVAGGKEVAVEDIKIGDQTTNQYHATGLLTVTDTAKGVELSPMIYIEDEAKRSLLMTEMHPVQTIDRGMVLAKALVVDDRVMTRTGPSRLVRIERRMYDGKVFNLKVGSKTEKTRLGEDQTVFYANGFVVGDGQIQSRHTDLEMKRLTQKKGHILERLPRVWHEDYLAFAARQRSQGRQ
jgi:hypothetical protein